MIQKLNHVLFISLIFLLVSGLIVYFERKDLLRFILSIKIKAHEYKYPGYPRTLLYRLYSPNKKTGFFPLVLYLHGSAQRGNDNKKQLDGLVRYFTSPETQKKFPSFFLAPQCPFGKTWTLNNDKPFVHYNQSDYTESEEIQLTINLINDLVRLNQIDINRIYVIGYSMGGTGVWDIITRHPDLFAAAVPISGTTDISRASVIRHLPVRVFLGELDSAYPLTLGQDMCNLINNAGGECILTVFENIGHDKLIKETLKTEGLLEWMFNQQKKAE